MSIREKNTKERILDEALRLFAQSGYMGTSMNDIADRMGVTKAALYKHYKSKQEILDSILRKQHGNSSFVQCKNCTFVNSLILSSAVDR